MVTIEGTPSPGGYRLRIAGGLMPPSRTAFLEYLGTQWRPDPRFSAKDLEDFRHRCPGFEPYIFTDDDLTAGNHLVDQNRLVAIIEWVMVSSHSPGKEVWNSILVTIQKTLGRAILPPSH